MTEEEYDRQLDELNCTLEDEEAAHAETLDMLKLAQCDRDAGWDAAEKLAGALKRFAEQRVLPGAPKCGYLIGWMDEYDDMLMVGDLQAAAKALAAYAAAKAARGQPAPTGKQVVGVHYNPNPEGRT